MRKILTLILALIMIFILAACAPQALVPTLADTENGAQAVNGNELPSGEVIIAEAVPSHGIDVLPLAMRHVGDWPNWEYRLMGSNPALGLGPEINSLGQEGWLLVGIASYTGQAALANNFYIFVRPIP